MKLWQAWVGGGRFLVRANDEREAIALARVAAEDYNPSVEVVQELDAGAELLDHEGDPEVLNIDYS